MNSTDEYINLTVVLSVWFAIASIYFVAFIAGLMSALVKKIKNHD